VVCYNAATLRHSDAARAGAVHSIISGHGIAPASCPFFPSKQTFVSASGTSAVCQKHSSREALMVNKWLLKPSTIVPMPRVVSNRLARSRVRSPSFVFHSHLSPEGNLRPKI
jgi:hypothetical protein